MSSHGVGCGEAANENTGHRNLIGVADYTKQESSNYDAGSQVCRYPPEINLPDIDMNGAVSGYGWTRTKDGWWLIWDDKYFAWSRIAFQLTERRNKYLQGVHSLKLPVAHPSDENGVIAVLRDILKDVTELKVDGSFAMDPVMKNLEWILKMDDDVAPCLLSLEFMGGKGIPSTFHAMKLGRLKRLESFVVRSAALADADMLSLAGLIAGGCLPSLSELCLPQNNFHANGVESLADTLGKVPSLRVLDLSLNDVGAGHQALAKAMASGHLKNLETLDLQGTGIVPSYCEAYGRVLCSGRLGELKNIDFAGNEVGVTGAKALGQGICRLQNLITMDLSRNKMGDEGMIELATSFEVGYLPKLRFLKLGFNHFTEMGILKLSSVLTSGQMDSLESLDLRYNEYIVTESCARVLISILSRNSALKAQIEFDWYRFPALDILRRQLEDRNLKRAKFLADLDLEVPATFGKVYICGSPEVGKTTLRKSLQRGFLESLCIRERRPHEEKHTRGIEVSELISRGKRGENLIRLALWDMAGQEEYHMVHNAFFPDLSFAEGKATTFILVCNPQNEEETKQQLKYWLRFIASSCGKSAQRARHVLVVLNRMGGDSEILRRAGGWEHWLRQERERFHGYLNIQPRPFIVDVRKRLFVKDLKRCLIDHSRDMLRGEMVPEICLFIQNNLRAWTEERKQFPVLRWEDFKNKVWEKKNEWTEKTLEAATKYLNEGGVLIYIRKEFRTERGISMMRFVVLDPNWFCKEVVGNMFLPQHLVRTGETLMVNSYDQSISITELQNYFTPMLQLEGDSSKVEKLVEDLVAILMWLGLCYEGKDKKVFIPALIDRNHDYELELSNPLDHLHHKDESQWVMGYIIEHKASDITLAPIALWHRFQVELPKSSKFNGQTLDSDFSFGRYFVTFKVNYMNVLIKVNASKELPTFDHIDIFVKPVMSIDTDFVNVRTRKELQVDLASSLVEMLLRLWNEVCPGVEYVHKVVWPWPVYHSRKVTQERNLEVVKLMESVQKHGLGRSMQWMVESDPIQEDQLLSKRESKYALEAVCGNLHIVRESIKEAVELGIFSPDDLSMNENETQEASSSNIEELQRASTSASKSTGEAILPNNESKEIMDGIQRLLSGQDVLLDLTRRSLMETKVVRSDLMEVMAAQKKVFQKVVDVGQFFLEDRERSCPRFVYVGRRNSGSLITLKDALSPLVKVHLHFLCEAHYNDYGLHEVKEQQGLDVSHLTDWAQKILPWLKVSLTVLFISAKVAANLVAPGVGLISASFGQMWNQVSTLSEGLALTTGYSKQELDKLMKQDNIRVGSNSTGKSPQELHGDIRKAMTEFLGQLGRQEYEQRLSLQKVHLRNHGVVWICNECYKKYRLDELVSDL